MSNLNPPVNRLLAALPKETYQYIFPNLEYVELHQHQVIYFPEDRFNYAYFPSHSIISTVAILENGATTEIGVSGNEGMVGVPIILDTNRTSFTAIVQVGGDGYRIAAPRLRQAMRLYPELKSLLMDYVQARIIELGQTAACNRFHSVEQRFARWLLTVSDSIQNDRFQLTQEFIAQMIGVRRSGVSEIASKFQSQNIIRYRRGKIEIIAKKQLEASACECYRLIESEFARLL